MTIDIDKLEKRALLAKKEPWRTIHTNDEMLMLIEAYKKQNSDLNKFIQAFKSAQPEKYDVLFITGTIGEIDSIGCPEYIMICPHYGLDGFAVYKKEKEYTSPEW